MMNSRRSFLFRLAASAGTPALFAGRALAQTASAPVKLEESDPLAIALGFKKDTTKVDSKKYPKHSVDQKCSGCNVYKHNPGDTMGPCAAVGNKLVPADGWCAAYVKKTGAAK